MTTNEPTYPYREVTSDPDVARQRYQAADIDRSGEDVNPTAVDPTTDELRDYAVETRDALSGLLADSRRWALDVAQVVPEDDLRREAAELFADDVARAADEVALGAHWLERYPTAPYEPGSADDLRAPSIHVAPSGAADLFDGLDAATADVDGEDTQSARQEDIVARSGTLRARAEVLRQKATTLAEDSVEWINQAEPSARPEMYSGHTLFADAERASAAAIAQVRSFEQDTLHEAHTPDEAPPSTAALFAASTDELLADAEAVQLRAHGWVDDVASVLGADSVLYDRAELAAGSVDHTVASLRNVTREFGLFDDPAAEGAAVEGDMQPEAAAWADEVTEPAANMPDRATVAGVGGVLSADLDDLQHAVSSLRDEAADWRLLAAVDEAAGDARRLEHAHDAANALDEATASTEVGARQLADLAHDLREADNPGETVRTRNAEQTVMQELSHRVANSAVTLHADTRDWLANAHQEFERNDPDYDRMLAAAEAVDEATDRLHAVLASSDGATPEAGLALAGTGRLVDAAADGTREPTSVITEADDSTQAHPDVLPGQETHPFDSGGDEPPRPDVGRSIAAAEHGLHAVRLHQSLAAQQTRSGAAAYEQTADRTVDVGRDCDRGPVLGTDLEPPF